MNTTNHKTVNTTTPWTCVSAYVALGFVSLGASWSQTPFLVLHGLPLWLAGMVACAITCSRVSGAELKQHPGLALLCALAALAVGAGAGGCASAADHFLDARYGAPLLPSISVSALGAGAMAYAVRRSRQCAAKETLPHFLYWFLFGPLSYVVTWIRGANGAIFGA